MPRAGGVCLRHSEPAPISRAGLTSVHTGWAAALRRAAGRPGHPRPVRAGLEKAQPEAAVRPLVRPPAGFFMKVRI